MKKHKLKIQIIILGVILAILAGIAFLYEPDLPLEQLKASYANSNSKFMQMGSMQVHYRIEGQGPPLVLIHGTGAMLQTYDEWTAMLSSHYTVIRMDIPAFGLTGPRPDGNYADTMYVNFIENFVTQLGLDTFSLAGNSLGGLIAWKYAAAKPQKVQNLILIDPAGFYELNSKKGSFVFNMARNHPTITKLIAKVGTQHLIKKTLKEVFYDDTKVTPEKLKIYTELNRREGNRTAFTDRAQFVHPCNNNELKAIACPTLVMWGKEDVLINVGEAEHFKNIPNAKFIFYDKIGHIPQEENPQQSAADVLEFLKQRP